MILPRRHVQPQDGLFVHGDHCGLLPFLRMIPVAADHVDLRSRSEWAEAPGHVRRASWGWARFGVVWGLALAGIVLKSGGRASRPTYSTGLYLSMGWLVVVAVDPLFARVPAAGLLWLLAGGLSYTVGVALFAMDSCLHFGHSIWHLCVMAGTACHYVAVLW